MGLDDGLEEEFHRCAVETEDGEEGGQGWWWSSLSISQASHDSLNISSFMGANTSPKSSSSSRATSSSVNCNRSTCLYSHKEFLDLRAKGLCCKCKQPYHPLHDCPNKPIRALIMGDDEDIPPDVLEPYQFISPIVALMDHV